MVRTLLAVLVFSTALIAEPAGRKAGTDITPDSVLEQMNLWRERHGLPALRSDFRLAMAAEDRMRDMEELAYWSHRSPEGRSPFAWIPLRGYRYAAAGENLASGFETAELVVTSWMESRGHRENILSPHFVDVGVAVIDGSPSKRISGRSIVVLFARERIAEPIRRRAKTDQSRETNE